MAPSYSIRSDWRHGRFVERHIAEAHQPILEERERRTRGHLSEAGQTLAVREKMSEYDVGCDRPVPKATALWSRGEQRSPVNAIESYGS